MSHSFSFFSSDPRATNNLTGTVVIEKSHHSFTADYALHLDWIISAIRKLSKPEGEGVDDFVTYHYIYFEGEGDIS